jgi:L-seryl-tRNA(Ser) seleniumtransferase
VQESLAAGADLVCFSGDKLLGGPQAGLIVGKADLMVRLKKHPLARAIRADKICLAALSATLLHYLKDEAEREVPVWRMISASQESLRQRALSWQSHLGQGKVIPEQSTIGGGSLPGEILASTVLALTPATPNRFLALLRQGKPPVIARLQDGQVLFDPRTVLPEQDKILISQLHDLLENTR